MTDPTEPTPDPAPSRGGPTTEWSRRNRDRRRDNGSLFFGLLLLLVGGYFLLRDTLHVRLPNIGELWPIFLIALGAWIVLNAARRDDRA